MTRFKRFWIVFVSFLPFSAGAVAPIVAGLIAGGAAIIGASIYRSTTPMDMAGAMNFFSSCWTCELFSEIMSFMSGLIPRVYSALGKIIFPFALGLLGVWVAWKLLDGFLNPKKDKNILAPEDPWKLTSNFSTMLIKTAFVGALLLAPLPRILTNVVIEPIFNIGLSIDHVITDQEKFNTCVVATAIADPIVVDKTAANHGVFSPKLRHNLACEMSNVHQITGLGMTVGWTMLNMAFDSEYMHKIMWAIPIFPNVPLFFAGLLVLVLFLMALLPVPMYFLEIFITLSLDLIMLPLTLLSWLFKDWKIFPQGTKSEKNIRKIVDNVISNTISIAMLCVMLSFMIMFLDTIAGSVSNLSTITEAINNNDSRIFIDGIMMQNNSFITIILIGIFFTMFMTLIPTLLKTFFNLKLPDNFYKTTVKNLENLWKKLTKIYGVFDKHLFDSGSRYK